MLYQFWILFVINVVIFLRLIVLNIFNVEEKFIKKKIMRIDFLYMFVYFMCGYTYAHS